MNISKKFGSDNMQGSFSKYNLECVRLTWREWTYVLFFIAFLIEYFNNHARNISHTHWNQIFELS